MKISSFPNLVQPLPNRLSSKIHTVQGVSININNKLSIIINHNKTSNNNIQFKKNKVLGTLCLQIFRNNKSREREFQIRDPQLIMRRIFSYQRICIIRDRPKKEGSMGPMTIWNKRRDCKTSTH